MKTENTKGGAPFKLLLIDGPSRRWIVCTTQENPREMFKAYHNAAASARAVLWAIPCDASIGDSLTYTIPRGKPNWDWVRLGEVK